MILTLSIGIFLMLNSCEKCATCTMIVYDGSCTCDQTAGTEFTHADEYDYHIMKSNCEIIGCDFEYEPVTLTSEPCGKRKKQLDSDIDSLERLGYMCSDY